MADFRRSVIYQIYPKSFCDSNGDGRRFYSDGPRIHEFLKELVADTGIGDMITVCEMSSTSLVNCIRYSNPDEKEPSMCFNFHHLKVDYKDGNKWELMKPDYRNLKVFRGNSVAGNIFIGSGFYAKRRDSAFCTAGAWRRCGMRGRTDICRPHCKRSGK